MRGGSTLQETSASMGPTCLAEPPPPRRVGHREAARWVAPGVVGVGGFRSEADAVQAALIAHRTLARRAAQSRGAAPVEPGPPALALGDPGDRVLADGREIATLLRPHAGSADAGDARRTFGFELRLPPPADELHARVASYLIVRELRSSGLAWPPHPFARAS